MLERSQNNNTLVIFFWPPLYPVFVDIQMKEKRSCGLGHGDSSNKNAVHVLL
jgi:hypothetical protein